MKLIHFSDTHLGFSDLDIVNEQGINQREADFYSAFSQVIDAIIKEKPDFVLHTGDLFHRPHPSNRAISFALEQFKRISIAKIPTIIIAGNHSTPRTRATSPILSALKTLDYIYPVFEEKYEAVEFKNIKFHCIPHIHEDSANEAAIIECEERIDKLKKNILMMHCSVGAHYMMEEYGERVFPKDKEYLFEKMDYVALGHWHGFGQVGKHKNVFYSGSTERTSSSDIRNSKGYAIVTLENNNANNPEVEFIPIKLRPSYRITLDTAKCENIVSALREKCADIETKGALLYIVLQNLSATRSIDLSNREIEDAFPDTLNIQIQRNFKNSAKAREKENISAASLQEYFQKFLEEQASDEKEFMRLNKKLQEMFAMDEEAENDS